MAGGGRGRRPASPALQVHPTRSARVTLAVARTPRGMRELSAAQTLTDAKGPMPVGGRVVTSSARKGRRARH